MLSEKLNSRAIFCIVVVVLALALVRNIVDSRAGRAIRAVRDNDTAAAVHGVDLVRVRVSTFALSAGVAGLAGALQVVLVPFASQSNFPPQESLVLYATAVQREHDDDRQRRDRCGVLAHELEPTVEHPGNGSELRRLPRRRRESLPV